MPNIPLAQQASVFQPQTTAAPTQGFQALHQLFGDVQQEAFKLNDEQIQAGKLVGSNQIQNTIRQLQTDAATKFPGNYSQQQQFVNSGTQSFLKPFISSSHFANRSYFAAVSKNLLGAANFSYAKNIASQQLQNQRLAFDENHTQSVTNINELIRNGNSAAAKDKMGATFASVQAAVKFNIITPQQGLVYNQKALVSNNLAGAKNKIDQALALGGVPASLKMQGEILSDKNSPILNNPLLAQTYAAQVKSYVNGVNAGLKATQSANKSQINAIVNNTLKTGKVDVQKAVSFGIENRVAQAAADHSKTWEIFTEPAQQREKSLASLDLGTLSGLAISKNEASFEAVYNKDPMNWLMQQTSVNHGSALANANPEQLQNMRTTAVAIQRQRGDLQVKPMTNAEMQPVILAAQSGKIDDFMKAYKSYNNQAGQFSQSALIQLGSALKKNGIDDSVETISYLANKDGPVANNILQSSTQPLGAITLAASTRLNETPQKLTSDTRVAVQSAMQIATFSTPQQEKFISSLRNGAGGQQGFVLGTLQKQAERYAISAVANGKQATISDAIDQYFGALGASFNYMKQRNGQFIRIPLQFEGKALDQNQVRSILTKTQGGVKMSDVDLSSVRVPVGESTQLAKQKYWNTVGSQNHWVTGPDGESYFLMGNDNIALKSKKTGRDIRITNNQIFNAPIPQEVVKQTEQQKRDDLLKQAIQTTRLIKPRGL